MSPTEHHHQAFLLRLELEWAESKKELCLADGTQVEAILNGDFSALALEELFCDASFAICHDRNMHYNIATRIGWTFTPEQRRVLAYLFWKTFLVDNKRRRTIKARLHANVVRVFEAESEKGKN